MLRQYAEKFTIGNRLSLMMFLQFFIWGSWYVVGPLYLGSIGYQEGDIAFMYSVGPIACLISPFFVGMVADRFFSTEKVLGVMHILAAAAMAYATTLMLAEKPDPNLINIAFFVHMLFYFPTLALTNSLALHTMTDPEAQFPKIRVFGTIGWVVVGLLISAWAWDATINVFYMTVFSGLLLGVYSFTLPHTPPPLAGKKVKLRELVGADAFVLFRHKPFLIFMVSSILICIPLAFYYQMAQRAVSQAGIDNVASTMTYGQMSEILFMFLMPFFFKRLGVKWMLLVGMLAWVLRYILFGIGSPVPDLGGSSNLQWMLLIGIVLHGICYDFFFVTGQIYTDKVAPKEIRGQAQGMLALFTLGLGMWIGAMSAGQLEGWFTPKESRELHKEVVDMVQEKRRIDDELSTKVAELSKKEKATYGSQTKVLDGFHTVFNAYEQDVPPIEELGQEYTDLTGKQFNDQFVPLLKLHSRKNEIETASAKKTKEELQLKKWFWIWMIPAVFAGVIMIGFYLTFNETEDIDAGDTSPEDVEPPVESAEPEISGESAEQPELAGEKAE